MRLSAPDNRVYIGAGGMGKSYLARRHVAAFKRVIILDPTGDPANRKGALLIESGGDLCRTLARLGKRSFKICYRPMGDPVAEFETLNRAAMIAEDVTVWWDEAGLFMTAQKLPPAAFKIWNMGRHTGCRVFCVSQRAARVSRDCTGNVAAMYVFQQNDPEDVKWCTRVIGRQYRDQLSTFGVGQHVEWTARSGSTLRARA